MSSLEKCEPSLYMYDKKYFYIFSQFFLFDIYYQKIVNSVGQQFVSKLQNRNSICCHIHEYSDSENSNLKSYIQAHVYCSIAYNRQELKT